MLKMSMMNRGGSPDLYQSDDDDDIMERNSAGGFDQVEQMRCFDRSG